MKTCRGENWVILVIVVIIVSVNKVSVSQVGVQLHENCDELR